MADVSIPVKLVTWGDANRWSQEVSDEIKWSGYKVDVAIALARGGLAPTRLVADMLGIRDVISIKVEHWFETAEQDKVAEVKYGYKLDLSGKNVLIVDDICDTGDSFVAAKKYVQENFNPKEVRTAALQYIKQTAKYEPDYYAYAAEEWAWMAYPWNYWEDEINLVKKLLDSGKKKDDIDEEFQKSYGILPPIPTDMVFDEMDRRQKG
ncbi:MAG: phosphoribosyltransferase [Candidatus Micrarchaeota archaeon]|nr:phosphoribosyltransferase [Candidatus Micrarchaeota archaeon]